MPPKQSSILSSILLLGLGMFVLTFLVLENYSVAEKNEKTGYLQFLGNPYQQNVNGTFFHNSFQNQSIWSRAEKFKSYIDHSAILNITIHRPKYSDFVHFGNKTMHTLRVVGDQFIEDMELLLRNHNGTGVTETTKSKLALLLGVTEQGDSGFVGM